MLIRKKRSYLQSPGQRLSNGIFDYISCVFLALCVLLPLNSQFPIKMSVAFILSSVFVFSAVMFIVTVKPAVFAAAAGVFAAISALYITAAVKWNRFIYNLSGIFGWWISGMDPDSEFYSVKGFDTVFFTVTLGIALISFISVRLIKKSAVPAVVFGAVSVLLCALSSGENKTFPLVLYLAGSLSLVCRDHFSGKKLLSFKVSKKQIGSNLLFCAVSFVLCAAVAVSAVKIIPENTLRYHRRGAADKVADIQSKTGLYTAAQKEFKTATLHELGLSPDENKIGGNLEPAENYTIAEIQTDTDRELLFKTAVFDEFNGSKWTSSESKVFRIDGGEKEKAKNYFYSEAFADTDSTFIFNTHNVRVKLTAPSKGIFTSDKAENFKELSKSENPLLFNEHSEIFSFFGINEGYEYSFDTRLFPSAQCGNADKESINAINSFSLQYNDENCTDDFIRKYTKLPKYWSKTLFEYALNVKNSARTDYEKVLDFCALLSPYNDFSYTDLPGENIESISPCDRILIDKSGYSVLYGTAVCLMARTCNIPARLAAGYKSLPQGSGRHTLETGRRYAWAECYFGGIGWISFDPFAGANLESGKTNIGFAKLNSEQIKEAEENYTNFIGPENVLQSEKDNNKKISLLAFFIISFGGLILFVAIIMLLKLCLVRRFYDEKRICEKYSSNAAKAVFYSLDIKNMLEILSCSSSGALTLNDLSKISGGEEMQALCAPAANALDLVLFGEKAPESADIEKIKSARARLEEILKSKISKAKYFKDRMLLANISCKKADYIEKREKK